MIDSAELRPGAVVELTLTSGAEMMGIVIRTHADVVELARRDGASCVVVLDEIAVVATGSPVDWAWMSEP